MTAGSPRMALLQSKVGKKKLSPKGGVTKRHGALPKGTCSFLEPN